MGYLKAARKNRKRRSVELLHVVLNGVRGSAKTIKQFTEDNG